MATKSKSKSKNSKSVFGSFISRLAHLTTSDVDDIVKAIKDDHQDLRKFGAVLKSEDATMSEKKEAYKKFSSLLKSHSKSEEQAVYNPCLKTEELKSEVNEGFIEHGVADTLMKNIAATRNGDKWEAQVKVLAEVVEHHADEEEKEILPKLHEEFGDDQSKKMSHTFIHLREQSQLDVTPENAGILAKINNASTIENVKSSE